MDIEEAWKGWSENKCSEPTIIMVITCIVFHMLSVFQMKSLKSWLRVEQLASSLPASRWQHQDLKAGILFPQPHCYATSVYTACLGTLDIYQQGGFASQAGFSALTTPSSPFRGDSIWKFESLYSHIDRDSSSLFLGVCGFQRRQNQPK